MYKFIINQQRANGKIYQKIVHITYPKRYSVIDYDTMMKKSARKRQIDTYFYYICVNF